MASPLRCAAATGLAGDNLLCIDFLSIPDQPLSNPPPKQLMDWNFVANCGSQNWEIADGKLQIKDFSSFSGSCGFVMPALKFEDYERYKNFTLSIVQRLEILKFKQAAGIFLGQVVDSQQIWLSAGMNPRQASTISINKNELPNGGSGTYQPVFQVAADGIPGLRGWQIESIAINAN